MPADRDALGAMLYLPGESLVRATVDGEAAEWAESLDYVPSGALVEQVLHRSAALAARDVPVFRFPSQIERGAWASRQPIGRKRAASAVAALLGVSPSVLAAATVAHAVAFAALGQWVFRQVGAAAAVPRPVASAPHASSVTYFRLPQTPSASKPKARTVAMAAAQPRDTLATSLIRGDSTIAVTNERGSAWRMERGPGDGVTGMRGAIRQEFRLLGDPLQVIPEDARKVDVLVRLLRIVPGAHLRILGAGPVPALGDSLRKGRREAESFARVLVDHGVDRTKLEWDAMPIAEQTCPAREPMCGRARSRVIAEILAPALADTGLAGHWEATVQGDGRPFDITFDFVVHADTLTGTVTFPTLDRSFDVTRGTITGNEISFIALGIWRGRQENAVLYLTRELDGGKTQEMTARRKR